MMTTTDIPNRPASEFSTFAPAYFAASSARSKKRKDARARRAKKAAAEWEGFDSAERLEFMRWKADEIGKRILASIGNDEKLYTKSEGRLYLLYGPENEAEKLAQRRAEAQPNELIWRYSQSAKDRMGGSGYTHPGGLVAGKYWQDEFSTTEIVSDRHWLLKRFPAATARASSGQFYAGPSKSGCIPIYRKIVGYDEPHFMFGQRCKDMFRIDKDENFRSARHLRRWLAKLRRAGKIPVMPHVVVWIFDDHRPGEILHPHFYFILPEGSAVWEDEDHRKLLDHVISAITIGMGGDLGGLAHPFGGKNPLSPHCERIVLNDTEFPTLSDYAKQLPRRNKIDSELAARRMGNRDLKSVGFGDKSNEWFTAVADVCNYAADAVAKTGIDVTDKPSFLAGVVEVAEETVRHELPGASPQQLKTLDKLVRSCARWSVEHFDPRRSNAKPLMNGAAAHLMLPSDDVATRRRKGQAFAAERTVQRNRAEVALAIRRVLREDNREPTFREIADTTGFSLNTVKAHWFSAYVQAVAVLSIRPQVKGDLYNPAQGRQTTVTLQMATNIRQIPKCWRDPATDRHLVDHFRVIDLKLARRRRLKQHGYPGSGEPDEHDRVRIPPGVRIVDFCAAGLVHRFACGQPKPCKTIH